MKLFRRHHIPNTTAEIERARAETERSARQSEADLMNQAQKLKWERTVVAPVFRQLHDKNHVADAIIQLIEDSRKTT
jgi:hypothetical protein